MGRERELHDLHTAMRSGTGLIAQTVAGLGGVGKSALACRYAQMRQDAYSPVWWITADSPDRIEAGLAALAVRMVPELNSAPLPDAAAWARSWLACHDGWLLVLDDVAAPADVQELIGSLGGAGRFLITSRLAEGWQDLVDRPVTLGAMPAEDATELLRRSSGRADLPDAARLSGRLGHLPLAVAQAGAYLSQTGISVGEYLDLLDDSSAETFRHAAAGTPEDRTIAAVWTVTLDRIAAQDALALEVFRTLAWFAPDGIPRGLLTPMADQGPLVHALGLLRAYRMANAVGGSLSVHRLVQEVFRTPDAAIRHRDDEAVARARVRAVDLLHRARPRSTPGWRPGSGSCRTPTPWSRTRPRRRTTPRRPASSRRPRPSSAARTCSTGRSGTASGSPTSTSGRRGRRGRRGHTGCRRCRGRKGHRGRRGRTLPLPCAPSTPAPTWPPRTSRPGTGPGAVICSWRTCPTSSGSWAPTTA